MYKNEILEEERTINLKIAKENYITEKSINQVEYKKIGTQRTKDIKNNINDENTKINKDKKFIIKNRTNNIESIINIIEIHLSIFQYFIRKIIITISFIVNILIYFPFIHLNKIISLFLKYFKYIIINITCKYLLKFSNYDKKTENDFLNIKDIIIFVKKIFVEKRREEKRREYLLY